MPRPRTGKQASLSPGRGAARQALHSPDHGAANRCVPRDGVKIKRGIKYVVFRTNTLEKHFEL